MAEIALPEGRRRAVEDEPAEAERRLGIALPVGLQQFQVIQQAIRDVTRLDPVHDVDVAPIGMDHPRDPLRGHRRGKALAEGRDIARGEGNADGHRVATVGLEEIGARRQGFHQIGARHAAARPLGDFAFLPQHDDRAVQGAADLAGGDADHAGMPIAEDHMTGQFALGLGLAGGLLGHLLVDLLALAVDRIQLGGVAFAVVDGLRQQQVERQGRVGQATAGVDARTKPVGDVDRGEHAPGLHPAHRDEGAQPRAAGLAEGAQAMRGEDAVLGPQRHEVRDGAEGGEVEVVLDGDARAAFVAGEPEHLEDAVDELEDQAGGAERLPRRIGRVVHARIDQGAHGVSFLGDVMVDHDHLDAGGAQARHLGQRIGAAIQGDEQLRAGLGEDAVEGRHRKAVALLHAARDEVGGLGAEAAQAVHEHRGAGDAIHVVVAEDRDALAGGGGLDEPLRGGAQAADGEGVGDVGELRTQVTLRLALVGAQAREHGGDGFADS